MTIQQIIFIVLSLAVLGSALFVVTTRNLFRAALMLILTFFCVAGYYVLLEAGFFAVAQVLVYIGAISILMIFAVMLTRGMMGMQRSNSQALASAALCAGLFVGLFLVIVNPVRGTLDPQSIPVVNLLFRYASAREIGGVPWVYSSAPVAPTYIDQLGRALTDPGQYALPFEAASVLILLAMIGAIWVARERRPAEMIAERAQIAAEDADELKIQQALEGASTAAGAPVPAAAIAEH